MSSADSVLHLSIPVHDLDAARHFYVEVLDCSPGRVRQDWIDVWFFGLQLTLQLRPAEVREPTEQGVLHFGVAMTDPDAFLALLERLAAHGIEWLSAPVTHDAATLSGKVGGKLADPSGNVIEIKYYESTEQFRR